MTDITENENFRPMITNVDEFIKALGGNKKAVEVFKTGSTTISMWKKRKRFPPWAIERALDIARTNKIRVDPQIFAIHRPVRTKGKAAAQATQ